MDGVYSCCDRTESEVMSDIVAYELQKFRRRTLDLILGPVFDNEKENCRTITKKKCYAYFKNSSIKRQ